MSDDKKDAKPKKAKAAGEGEAKAKAGPPPSKTEEKRAAKSAKGKGEAATGPATTTQSEAQRAKGVTLKDGEKYVPRAKKRYDDVIRKQLVEKFNYKNPMQVPKLEKIVINMGVGETTADTKKIQS